MLQFSNNASGDSTDGILPLTWVPDLKDKFPLCGLLCPRGEFPWARTVSPFAVNYLMVWFFKAVLFDGEGDC
jgi:hypothetical protein